jgi:hypothetical protein
MADFTGIGILALLLLGGAWLTARACARTPRNRGRLSFWRRYDSAGVRRPRQPRVQHEKDDRPPATS